MGVCLILKPYSEITVNKKLESRDHEDSLWRKKLEITD